MICSSPAAPTPNIYSLSINGEWNQLIACNFTDKPTTISVPLSGNQADTGALGLQPNKHYYLYDFWNDRFIGKIPGKQSAKLPVQADQALSYSVHQVKDHPQFISTNRHIMQGLMDLKDVKWDPKTGIYSGIAKVIGGEDFTITIANNNYATTAITVSTGTFSIATGQHDLTRFTPELRKKTPKSIGPSSLRSKELGLPSEFIKRALLPGQPNVLLCGHHVAVTSSRQANANCKLRQNRVTPLSHHASIFVNFSLWATLTNLKNSIIYLPYSRFPTTWAHKLP